MFWRPSARRTYSTKSVESARRTSPVRWSSLETRRAGHEVDAIAAEVGVRVPVAVVEAERDGAVAMARSTTSRGKRTRSPGRVDRQAGLEEAAAHLRAADLHAGRRQHAQRLVDDPLDELVRQDVQAGAHQAANATAPADTPPRAPHRVGRAGGGPRAGSRRGRARPGARAPAWATPARGSGPAATIAPVTFGDVGLLFVALLVILAGAELFTNGIEWVGRKLDLAEGAVGSVLAAVGTAMPETMIPVVRRDRRPGRRARLPPPRSRIRTERSVGTPRCDQGTPPAARPAGHVRVRACGCESCSGPGRHPQSAASIPARCCR